MYYDVPFMSVIAAMIGAGGLGREVLKAMQTVDIGLGLKVVWV